MNPYTKEYFEGGGLGNYTGYEDDPKFEHRADEVIRLLDEKRTKKLKVLEIGCAKGFLVKHLRDNGVEAWGIDVSDYAISQAPENIKDFVQVWDATEPLPFKDNEFDAVISYEVLEHIEESASLALLAECRRVGKDQIHMIGCIEYDFGGDHTHINLKPFTWWADKFPRTFISRCNEKDSFFI